MMNNDVYKDNVELTALCNTVREFICQKKFRESENLIKQAMGKYPHSPEPHNLMGIQLENEGDHLTAMKHFRAAWALDPNYLPARFNKSQYAEIFCKEHKDAYNEADCPQEQESDLYKIEYNENGVGHVVKRNKNNNIISKK